MDSSGLSFMTGNVKYWQGTRWGLRMVWNAVNARAKSISSLGQDQAHSLSEEGMICIELEQTLLKREDCSLPCQDTRRPVELLSGLRGRLVENDIS